MGLDTVLSLLVIEAFSLCAYLSNRPLEGIPRLHSCSFLRSSRPQQSSDLHIHTVSYLDARLAMCTMHAYVGNVEASQSCCKVSR